MNRPTRRNPAGGPGFGTDHQNAMAQLYGTPRKAAYLPRDWRQRLPSPDGYYCTHLDKLGQPNADGWASARCPFHDDKNASLSVKLTGRGHWKCFAACGSGDMVTFHERLTGQDFKRAVRDLLGMRT